MNARRSWMLGLSLLTATVVRAATPTTAPTTNPSAIEAREWVVFVVDAQGRANARQAWPSTLPPFITSRRGSGEAGGESRAAPIGVIRLYGALDPQLPIDVLLTPPGGEVEASWPRGQTKPGRLLWSNLAPPTASAKPPAALEAASWLAPLRTGDAATFNAADQTESFLLYDIALTFKPPLTIKADGDGLIASNTGSTPMHDVTFYKKRDGQWTRATLTALDGQAPPPPAKPTTAPADPAAAFDGPKAGTPATAPAAVLATVRNAMLSASRPAATQPTTSLATKSINATTQATTRPAERGTKVALSPADTDDRTKLISAWQPLLTDAGVPATDIGTVEKILADRGLDDRWLTITYRLDPAELDRLLPLEIIPAPSKITRVGLVIVRGLDPAINDEIDRLIKQCGADDYKQRKEATALLIALGQPAKAKLEKAQANPDVEIAQRAEIILAAIAKQQAN